MLRCIEDITGKRPAELDWYKFKAVTQPKHKRDKKALDKFKTAMLNLPISDADVELINERLAARENPNLIDISVQFDQGSCVICRQADATWIILPCRHKLLCAACYLDAAARPRGICPCCRGGIRGWFHEV